MTICTSYVLQSIYLDEPTTRKNPTLGFEEVQTFLLCVFYMESLKFLCTFVQNSAMVQKALITTKTVELLRKREKREGDCIPTVHVVLTY